jgi:hypothetical protein
MILTGTPDFEPNKGNAMTTNDLNPSEPSALALDKAQDSNNQEAEAPPERTTSPAKLAANRRNAQRSTGPKTLEGKARSRWNAVKHGVLANRLLIFEATDREVYEHLLASLCDDLCPANSAEAILVEQIAMSYWRLHLCYGYEADLCRTPSRFAHWSDRTGRYATAIHRQLLQNLAQLERLQRRRSGENIPAPLSVNLNLIGPDHEGLNAAAMQVGDTSEIVVPVAETIECKDLSTLSEEVGGAAADPRPSEFLPNEPNAG